ncbi:MULTISPECIES: nickel insertion protein [Anaerococcus]|uniref:nickel insertion protein n=1 Tax=Anaerococcus TaxID=165779 RepID=UPI002353A786|nr:MULTISPECIES: nickel insertion protein [Anaerococcus]MDU3177095.1 nickel insertion protein [Anaerococcus sp.]MDU7411238.1 nickel insertion protein [Anaerococcus sp.]
MVDECMKYALDVFYTPIYMKKNRPAYKLSIICDLKNEKKIEDLIFKHTTSIGIRKIPIKRDILDRKKDTIIYKGNRYQYKIVSHNGKDYVYPEFESARELALNEDIGIKSAFDLLKILYNKN